MHVRPYQEQDRASLHRIAADTAFFGAPVERFLEDRRLFLDAFYSYYTDRQPQYAWVAEAAGQVIGFLTGCTDTRRQRWAMQIRLLTLVLPKLLLGRYCRGPFTRRYVRGLIRADLRGELPPVDLKAYPAHLHINIEAGWRGHGLGRRLLDAYLDQLAILGLPGVHLDTTDQNRAACRLYEKVGFRLLDARPTQLWDGFVDQPVENRLYGMRL